MVRKVRPYILSELILYSFGKAYTITERKAFVYISPRTMPLGHKFFVVSRLSSLSYYEVPRVEHCSAYITNCTSKLRDRLTVSYLYNCNFVGIYYQLFADYTSQETKLLNKLSM